MSAKYIGSIVGGKDIGIGSSSPNRHIVITGISGSGKSVRIAEIEVRIISAGGTVVAFDINGTHSEMPEELCNVISVLADGLDVKFLDTSMIEQGRETQANLIDYVIETICPREMRGARQLASVRKAINIAIKERENFTCDIDAIAHGLSEQEEHAALGAYNHLCSILEGNIFRNSEKRIEENKINIISLQGLNPRTQKRIVEIMLNVLWRKMRIEGRGKERFTLVIDEFQNIDFRPGTALFQMLTEVRQYGVELLLAT